MSRVITFSPKFPSYHPKAGESTNFEAAIWKGLKKNHLQDKTYSIYISHPKLLKSGYWQIPIGWRDLMVDDYFKPKYHTIRAGNRWKVGDVFSPRVWSNTPYKSKQIIIGPDIEIKKEWQFELHLGHYFKINGRLYDGEVEGHHELLEKIAFNDGLGYRYYYDLTDWFPKQFYGQIICWNEDIYY